MLVVIGILVIATSLAVGTLSSLDSVKLRTQTNKLASGIRHAYNRAAAHGLYLRMVFDMESQTWWVEASTTPVFLKSGKRDVGDDPYGLPGEDDDADPDEIAEKYEESPSAQPRRAQYTEDGVIPKTKMEDGVQIEGVITAGQKDVFNDGLAYLHFFFFNDTATTEIYTTDADEESFYTLTVSPLTGKVTRQTGKIDPDRRFSEPAEMQDER
jgi:hypothetical protein